MSLPARVLRPYRPRRRDAGLCHLGQRRTRAARAVVTARLTDHASGQVLWSETYERGLTAGGIYDVQADLTADIVGRLAQVYGVITEATTQQLRRDRAGDALRL